MYGYKTAIFQTHLFKNGQALYPVYHMVARKYMNKNWINRSTSRRER